MTIRSEEERHAEILKLEKILPDVVRLSAFGDDHHAAIKVQIEVVRHDISSDGIAGGYPKGNLLDAADEARAWLDGIGSDDLADEWLDLVPQSKGGRRNG